MKKSFTFFEKDLETLDRERLMRMQLANLRATVARALSTEFYRSRLNDTGLKSPEDITSLDNLKDLPFTTKDDLREAYPDKLIGVPKQDAVRLHTSSGTTGTPTVIYHTQDDIDVWARLMARCIVATGAGREDVFQNMTTYGLFTGGLGLHYGAEQVGMLVIPASSGNTDRQLKLMEDFGTTVVHATPSYLLHIHDVMTEQKRDRTRFRLRKAFLGAEPYSESTRRKIEDLWKIDVYNSYGLSEMNGPGVAFECVFKEGMHVWEDAFLTEIIDPVTLKVVSDGCEGELVFTTLKRNATPLIRYRTRDLTSLNHTPCPCGRTHRRLARIRGRSDDMLIINGVNIFPSQIESVLMLIPEMGTNYNIVIEKQGALDKMFVKLEVDASVFNGQMHSLNELRRKIALQLKASILVNPVIELHEPGALPVSEGKARRVFDNRPAV
jgi:phenylacetate-CoA ligase